jgi:hypothetical protein
MNGSAYNRTSHVGKRDKALAEAPAKGWTVVDMKQDWNVVFPPKKIMGGRNETRSHDTNTRGRSRRRARLLGNRSRYGAPRREHHA